MNNYENQQNGSFLHDSGTNPCISDLTESRSWMKSRQRDKIVSIITRCFQKVDDDWLPCESRRIVDVMECLMFNNIDTDLLLKRQVKAEGITFNFKVIENIGSAELLDTLMEYHPTKWRYIKEAFMEDNVVDLVYEDRYMTSPLGCLILAQFIRSLGGLFALTFRSIKITVSKVDFHVMFDDDTLKIDRRFSYVENRDKFLRQCMDEIVGLPYILEVKNTKHLRSLIISNSRFMLSIHPDGGISHGWGIENGVCSHLTVDVLKHNLDTNIPCFNRAAHEYDRRGIPYVVSFSPIQKK